MIVSFQDSVLESFYYSGPSRKTKRVPSELHSAIRRKLDQLNSATDINDLRVPPANHLELLKGDLKGKYSIRVNSQWRIVFRWDNDAVYDVQLIDYH